MTPARPLPNVRLPATAPFWEGLRDRRVEMQRCPECGFIRWPVAPRCPQCLRPGEEWVPLQPSGTLWSYATFHRAFHPAFAAEVPYHIASVELDDGPMVIGRLVTDPGERLAIGSPVMADFERVDDEVTLLRWRLRGHE